MRDGRTASVSPMADIGKLNLIAVLGRDLGETVRAHQRNAAAGEVVLSVSGFEFDVVRNAGCRARAPDRRSYGLRWAPPHRGRPGDLRRSAGCRNDRDTGRPVSPRELAEAIALGVGHCSVVIVRRIDCSHMSVPRI